jgi:hypothetical protein
LCPSTCGHGCTSVKSIVTNNSFFQFSTNATCFVLFFYNNNFFTTLGFNMPLISVNPWQPWGLLHKLV